MKLNCSSIVEQVCKSFLQSSGSQEKYFCRECIVDGKGVLSRKPGEVGGSERVNPEHPYTGRFMTVEGL